MIFFDNNSTTRMFDCVVEAMRPFFTERFANPSSAIAQFSGLGKAIRAEKDKLVRALGADEVDQFVITSGATESNNLALLGAARANPRRRQIILSSIEHPSVMEVAEHLREKGYRLDTLPISQDGLIQLDAVQSLLSAETLLVSVILANNETGVIQPVGSLASIVKQHDSEILLHTDATQAVGKIPIDLSGELEEVDLLSLSAHKFHGPKGVGALFVRDSESLLPIFHGGGQQNGLRAGTENPASVVGMVTALTTLQAASAEYEKVKLIRDRLQRRILALCPNAFALGGSAERIPNTLNMCLPGVNAEDLVDRMAARGVAISAGSACSYGSRKPSYVVLAHGLTYEQGKSCIRLSLSIESTDEEANGFLKHFAQEISQDYSQFNPRLESA